MVRLFLLISFVVPALWGCNEQAPVDGKKMRREMDQRRLFRITEPELIGGGQRLGEQMVRQVDSSLKMRVAAQPAVACTAALAPLLARLAQDHQLKVSRLRFDAWAPPKDLPKVSEVLEAVRYTHNQGQPVPTNLQKDGQEGFHYVEALTVTAVECRNCHKAWRIGETVGVYSLRFPRRQAVLEASKGKKGML